MNYNKIEFFTSQEAAEFVGVKRITVLKAIEQGKLKAKKFGTNYLILKPDILAWRKQVAENMAKK